MLILNQLPGVSAATGGARFETSPEVITTCKQVNPGTPPATLLCMFITLEDVVTNSTIIPSRQCICV
jgi:hypothetical protein